LKCPLAAVCKAEYGLKYCNVATKRSVNSDVYAARDKIMSGLFYQFVVLECKANAPAERGQHHAAKRSD